MDSRVESRVESRMASRVSTVRSRFGSVLDSTDVSSSAIALVPKIQQAQQVQQAQQMEQSSPTFSVARPVPSVRPIGPQERPGIPFPGMYVYI